MQLAPMTATAWSGLNTLARPLSNATGDFAAMLSSALDEPDAPPKADDKVGLPLQDQQQLATRQALTSQLKTPAQLFSDAEADLVALQRQLADLFREAGIDLSQDVRLQIDAAGQVRVAGDHPDKAAIEQVLASQPQLSNELRRITAAFDLMRAGKAHAEFAAAYERDPQAAVSAFAHLFTDRTAPPSVLVLNEFQATMEAA